MTPTPITPTLRPPTEAELIADIPSATANQAFEGTSFTPERRGQTARQNYADALTKAWADFHAEATKGGTLALLQAEYDRYRAGYRQRLLKWLHSRHGLVSSMIAGPSRFPAARMNKRADISARRLNDLIEWESRARRAILRDLRPDLRPIRPIMSGDADAVERLEEEVARMERDLEKYRAINRVIRRTAKATDAERIAALADLGVSPTLAAKLLAPDPVYGQGIPSFTITNAGARLRSQRKRLEHLRTAKAQPATESIREHARLEDDPPANRIRIFFPGKPAADVIDQLKRGGFRWTPSLGCWQAYRSYGAIEIAKHLAGAKVVEADATATATATAAES